MPYFFLKQKEPSNQFDISDIKFTVEAVTASDITEQFYQFMLACGYHPDSILGSFEQILEEKGQNDED